MRHHLALYKQARAHPVGFALLRRLAPGLEYVLQECQEPRLYVIKCQHRTSATAATALAVYYVLEGSIYQAPTLHAALSSRIVRLLSCLL